MPGKSLAVGKQKATLRGSLSYSLDTPSPAFRSTSDHFLSSGSSLRLRGDEPDPGLPDHISKTALFSVSSYLF